MILPQRAAEDDRGPGPPDDRTMQFPSFAEYTEALQLDLSVVLSDPVPRACLSLAAATLP